MRKGLKTNFRWLIVLLLLAAMVAGCGGGSKKVATNTAAVKSLATTSANLETSWPLGDTFDGNVNSSTLFSTYRYQADGSTPMYRGVRNASNILISNGALVIGEGGLISIGDCTGAITQSGQATHGMFNLTGSYEISFKVVSKSGTTSKKFQVMVDNNTTTASASYHGSASRVYNQALSGIAIGSIVTIKPTVGTATSFIALRMESSATITIDDLYIGPVGGRDAALGGGGSEDPGSGGEDPGSGGETGDGWLGNGVVGFGSGTTGGAGGVITYVSTGTALQNAIDQAENGAPQIIYVNGTITQSNSSAEKINVKEVKNVSIIGVGTKGVLNGIGIKVTKASNIIIQNLTIHHNLSGDKDCISIEGPADHIWVDHCELYNDLNHDKDYYDELISAKKDSQYMTFSWNYLHDSWKTSLIGSSDSDNKDRKITYHHNRISNCNSRLPSYRFGTGHIYNNLYQNAIESGINSRMGAQLLIENNYFEACTNPIGSWYSDSVGYWNARGNIFSGCVDGNGNPLTSVASTCSYEVPYSYNLDSASNVKSIVLNGAGVGKL